MSAHAESEGGIGLRDVTANDVAFLRDVYASTRWDELALTDWTDDRKLAFCRMQFEAQDAHYRAHYQTARFSVIERGGVSVGRLYVDRWAREIRIMDIALLPACRGRGVGTRLLADLQREAREAGKSLSVHVEKFNPALHWYRRLGFSAVEDKEVYLLLSWEG